VKRSLLLLAAGLAVLAFSTTLTPAQAALPPFMNGSVQPTSIIGSGSDTTHFLMDALSAAYNQSEGCELVSVNFPETGTENQCKPEAQQPAGTVTTENYDHDVAWGYFPQGSNAGRRQLCSQTNPRPAGVPFVTYARSSSAPDVGFQCPVSAYGNPTLNQGLKLRFVAFAKDALTWVYWAGQTPFSTNLTQSQLNDIFVDCTITNWSQIGGENQPITVFTAIPGSGSRSSWDTFVGGSSDVCIPAEYKDGNNTTPVACPGERVVREHQAALVEDDVCAPNERYSIFFASVGVHNSQPAAKASSLFGSVEGFAPTEANIQTGDFPFSRFMYNAYRLSGPAPLVNAQTLGFVGSNGWICKPAGQHAKPVGDPGLGTEFVKASRNYHQLVLDTIRDQGFIPLREAGNKCNVVDVTSV
jgi:ABC-type phosphate transport system substrate-binding protein